MALHRIVNRGEKVDNQAECKIPLQLHVILWLRIEETTMVTKGNLRKTLVRLSRRIAMKRAHVMEVKKEY